MSYTNPNKFSNIDSRTREDLDEDNLNKNLLGLVSVDQLEPHIWVTHFAKFQEVTNGGTQGPANADPFTTGGLLVSYADTVKA